MGLVDMQKEVDHYFSLLVFKSLPFLRIFHGICQDICLCWPPCLFLINQYRSLVFQGRPKNETAHVLKYQFCCLDSTASNRYFQKT
jgi:hypothetical protein